MADDARNGQSTTDSGVQKRKWCCFGTLSTQTSAAFRKYLYACVAEAESIDIARNLTAARHEYLATSREAAQQILTASLVPLPSSSMRLWQL